MKKAPINGAGGTGSAECRLAHSRPLNQVVYPPAEPYVLTNEHGHFVALLSRRTGVLTRLGEGVRA